MKLIINEPLIKKNKTIGQVATFASLAVLVLGLVFAFGKDMTKILWSYAALIVGFVLSQVGMFFTNRYGRTPRFDEIFASAFEKLRHDYSFYVFSSPVPMVLLGPCGFWVPVPIVAGGKISYQKNKWRQEGGNFMMKFVGQEGIGKPDQDAKADVEALQKYLADKGIPIDQQPPIRHILVILMKNTELGDVSQAPIPVVELQDLKRYIRRVDREECTTPISEEELVRLNSVMEEFGKKNS
ncbi:MAG: hypothetical protein WA110_10275 [Anaerolineaceae bacterium]